MENLILTLGINQADNCKKWYISVMIYFERQGMEWLRYWTSSASWKGSITPEINQAEAEDTQECSEQMQQKASKSIKYNSMVGRAETCFHKPQYFTLTSVVKRNNDFS